MLNRFNKYFWDGKEGWSDEFKVRRIIEYASFPDLIHYPFDEVKKHLHHLNIDKLWTDEKRKQFIRLILPYLVTSTSWEEVIKNMNDQFFKPSENQNDNRT